LKRGLGRLGIRESDLEAKAKGSVEKQVLAWWLRKKTVLSGGGYVRKVDSGMKSEIRRQFNWQTSKNYANQCRTMVLTPGYTSKHIANFSFTR
jgi:hypothetical protein